MTDNEWDRVASALRRRVAEMGVSWVDLARTSGVSDATIRKLRQGEQGDYWPRTLGRLAKALGWPPDAFDRIRAGENVQPLPALSAEERLDTHEARLAELERRLAALEADDEPVVLLRAAEAGNDPGEEPTTGRRFNRPHPPDGLEDWGAD